MKKTALITGASGGLGLEFARLCAKENYDLVLVARSEGKLYGIRHDLEEKYGICVHVCAADLSCADAALDVYDYVLEHEIQVDVLINNAGFGDEGSFADSDWQKQYDMIQVNITVLMQLTHCFLREMHRRGSGEILNLSSVAAFCAGPDMSVYYATKAFVRSYSEAIAEEVRGTGLTVTALCPGPTATGFEKAAAMKTGSAMFRHAADATAVARDGMKAMHQGKVLCYQGAFTKLMSIGSRLAPRYLTRKIARKMNH